MTNTNILKSNIYSSLLEFFLWIINNLKFIQFYRNRWNCLYSQQVIVIPILLILLRQTVKSISIRCLNNFGILAFLVLTN